MSLARKLDQFYTQPTVARQCLVFLAQHRPTPGAFYLEPSAGAGAFFENLPENARMGTDLSPRCAGVQQLDFFNVTREQLPSDRPVVVVGNPPFGKNASLAVRFVNRAAALAEVVAFVLPRTFKKASLQQRLDAHLHLLAEWDLPSNSFEFEGRPYDVPCVFQIWERRPARRAQVRPTREHPDFTFVKDPREAKFAVRRVGARAGKVLDDFAGYAASSHYFIAPRVPAAHCRDIFGRIDWQRVKFNTAGNPSIGKSELVALYHAARG